MIWIKFRRLVQNDMSTVVIWSKSKPKEQELSYRKQIARQLRTQYVERIYTITP